MTFQHYFTVASNARRVYCYYLAKFFNKKSLSYSETTRTKCIIFIELYPTSYAPLKLLLNQYMQWRNSVYWLLMMSWTWRIYINLICFHVAVWASEEGTLPPDFEIWFFAINFLMEKCSFSFGVGKMKFHHCWPLKKSFRPPSFTSCCLSITNQVATS